VAQNIEALHVALSGIKSLAASIDLGLHDRSAPSAIVGLPRADKRVACPGLLGWVCPHLPVRAPCYNFITATRGKNVMGGVYMAWANIHARQVCPSQSERQKHY
jgi:hypothetical protein